jgi:hypothetical protein
MVIVVSTGPAQLSRSSHCNVNKCSCLFTGAGVVCVKLKLKVTRVVRYQRDNLRRLCIQRHDYPDVWP